MSRTIINPLMGVALMLIISAYANDVNNGASMDVAQDLSNSDVQKVAPIPTTDLNRAVEVGPIIIKDTKKPTTAVPIKAEDTNRAAAAGPIAGADLNKAEIAGPTATRDSVQVSAAEPIKTADTKQTPPAIRPTTSLKYEVGESAVIECKIDIFVPPTVNQYYWFNSNQSTISEDGDSSGAHIKREVVSAAGSSMSSEILSLVFPRLRITDTGQYTCARRDETGAKLEIVRVVTIKVLPHEANNEAEGKKIESGNENLLRKPSNIQSQAAQQRSDKTLTNQVEDKKQTKITANTQQANSAAEKEEINTKTLKSSESLSASETISADQVNNQIKQGETLKQSPYDNTKGPILTTLSFLYNTHKIPPSTPSPVIKPQIKSNQAQPAAQQINEEEKGVVMVEPSSDLQPKTNPIKETTIERKPQSAAKSNQITRPIQEPENSQEATQPDQTKDIKVESELEALLKSSSVVEKNYNPSYFVSTSSTQNSNQAPETRDQLITSQAKHSSEGPSGLSDRPTGLSEGPGGLSDRPSALSDRPVDLSADQNVRPEGPRGDQGNRPDGPRDQNDRSEVNQKGDEGTHESAKQINKVKQGIRSDDSIITQSQNNNQERPFLKPDLPIVPEITVPSTTTTTVPIPTSTTTVRPSTTTTSRPLPGRPVMVTFDDDYDSIASGQFNDPNGGDIEGEEDDILKANSTGVFLVVALAIIVTGICAAVVLYRVRSRGRKSKYIAFGNPSYSREQLPANDLRMDHPLTLSSHGYTVLA